MLRPVMIFFHYLCPETLPWGGLGGPICYILALYKDRSMIEKAYEHIFKTFMYLETP